MSVFDDVLLQTEELIDSLDKFPITVSSNKNKWKRSSSKISQFSTLRGSGKKDKGKEVFESECRGRSNSDSATNKIPFPIITVLPKEKNNFNIKSRNLTVPFAIGNQRTLRRETNIEVIKEEEKMRSKTNTADFLSQNDSFREKIVIKNPSGLNPPLPKSCNIEKAIPLFKDELNKIFKQGFLVKRGHIRKNWKVRWFTLTRVALTYSSKPGTTDSPLGQIILYQKPSDIYVTPSPNPDNSEHSRQFVFKIVDNSTGKNYYFDAKTRSDLLDWVNSINQIIADNLSNISFCFFSPNK